jgi:hypothetical protein
MNAPALNISQPAVTMVALATIRTDGGTQSRASIFQNVVDDYAEAITGGAAFPPCDAVLRWRRLLAG